MTKEEVKRLIKSENGKGHDIGQAIGTYFAERIAERKIKPLEFYKSGDKIGGDPAFKTAQEIFSY